MAQPGAPRGEVGTVTQGNVAPNALLRTGQWSTFIEQAEHVPELRWPQSVEWYDRMLRTDSRIESGYMSLTQPLWDFVYAIEPNGAPATYVKALAGDLGLPVGMPDPSEDDDYEIPAGGYGFSFVDHLIEALLAPAFGHYYFETVGVIDGDMWHLTELSPRAPRTIMSIYAMPTGQLIGIRQNIIPFPTNLLSASGVNLASPPLIESERLAAYIWRGDAGARWIGRPMLRSLYRHWLVKDTLIRVDAINHERAGGVPGVETDQTWQGGDLGELKDAAAAFRVGEDAGYALPPGARMVLQRVGGTDVIGSIKYHDEQLGAQWEDQVGQLGQTLTGGNRALGQTFAGLQALARTAVARWFAATFRQQVIAKWWAFNVPMGAQGAQPKLPRLVFRPRREITGGLVQAVPVPPTEGGPLPEGGVPGQPGGQEPATGPPPVAAAGHPSPRASRPRSTEREGEAGRAGRGGVGDVRGDSSGAAQAGGSGGAQAEAPPLDAPRVRLPTNRPLRRQPYDFEVRARDGRGHGEATRAARGPGRARGPPRGSGPRWRQGGAGRTSRAGCGSPEPHGRGAAGRRSRPLRCRSAADGRWAVSRGLSQGCAGVGGQIRPGGSPRGLGVPRGLKAPMGARPVGGRRAAGAERGALRRLRAARAAAEVLRLRAAGQRHVHAVRRRRRHAVQLAGRGAAGLSRGWVCRLRRWAALPWDARGCIGRRGVALGA
jgi:hypothetical protein